MQVWVDGKPHRFGTRGGLPKPTPAPHKDYDSPQVAQPVFNAKQPVFNAKRVKKAARKGEVFYA